MKEFLFFISHFVSVCFVTFECVNYQHGWLWAKKNPSVFLETKKKGEKENLYFVKPIIVCTLFCLFVCLFVKHLCMVDWIFFVDKIDSRCVCLFVCLFIYCEEFFLSPSQGQDDVHMYDICILVHTKKKSFLIDKMLIYCWMRFSCGISISMKS